MAFFRFLLAPLCLLGACTLRPGTSSDSNPSQPEAGGRGGAGGAAQHNVAGSKNSARAGAGGHAGGAKHNADTADEDTDSGDESTMAEPDPVDAGAPDPSSAGAGTITDLPPVSDDPRQTCDLDGTCAAQCHEQSGTCGIESNTSGCELQGFTGATAQVACGERLVIGVACCGGCGCVPVEVYFDGQRCWQGIPQCPFPEFSNRFFTPHSTTTPNPSFIPPDSFYLGNGGVPGLGSGGGAGSGSGGVVFEAGGGVAGLGSEGVAGSGSGGTAGLGSEGVAGSGSGGIAGLGSEGVAGSGSGGIAGLGSEGVAGSGSGGIAGLGSEVAGSGSGGVAGLGTGGTVFVASAGESGSDALAGASGESGSADSGGAPPATAGAPTAPEGG